jgi:glycerate kinase
LALILEEQHGIAAAAVPGAGAAGGLGFGLMAFAGAKVESGFDLFARQARLEKHIRAADLVVTGEGSLDAQTEMGKGVGQIGRLCRHCGVPCVALAGEAGLSIREIGLFSHVRALTERTSKAEALAHAARLLKQLARETAHTATKVCQSLPPGVQ